MRQISSDLINEVLTARPLLFVSSFSENKLVNLSVYGTYLTIPKSKTIVLESSWYKTENNELKDTLLNVRNNKWLVLNVPNKTMLNKVYPLATPLPRNESEATKFSVEIDYLQHKELIFPYIKNAEVVILCSLEREFINEKTEFSLLNLEVDSIYLNESIPSNEYEMKRFIVQNSIHLYGNGTTDITRPLGNIELEEVTL